MYKWSSQPYVYAVHIYGLANPSSVLFFTFCKENTPLLSSEQSHS